ncbi:type III PLP-dependent enzyme [Tropicimonas sp. TH_r6]|uniref:type III PLP-dependent enzyme n=1 Tax=Tropicimonas sp. TH_r6 TaxID=3082085 RepID=UPI002952FEC9|nr:type III PLP-dependent enzyme [Tropicimonas sp. TH_r6]MDV7141313.1 type III PLP-dependent enzyme [Tropicimonas sp. TH_r6]
MQTRDPLSLLESIFEKASDLPTPCYIYDGPALEQRLAELNRLFGDVFTLSFAIKSNPNPEIVRQIAAATGHLDASSFFEVVRALEAGCPAQRISYSGPGKRASELERFVGCGAELVVEALDEIDMAARIAETKGVVQKVLLRINPDSIPKGFGAKMSKNPSQFGIDEGQMAAAIDHIQARPGLDLTGFHIYAGSNCLDASAIVENIANMTRIFGEAATLAGAPARKLIFGAGFGLPYHDGQEALDVVAVRDGIVASLAQIAANPLLAGAERALELGRWLVGPVGALVTTCLSCKESRGVQVAVCDAGFNAHLAACGMMGSVFQKNWPIHRLGAERGGTADYLLAGPLCTSIDTLARRITLPTLAPGDRIAVLMSGAYGLTASPSGFISHPQAGEYLWTGDSLRDISSARAAPHDAELPRSDG